MLQSLVDGPHLKSISERLSQGVQVMLSQGAILETQNNLSGQKTA